MDYVRSAGRQVSRCRGGSSLPLGTAALAERVRIDFVVAEFAVEVSAVDVGALRRSNHVATACRQESHQVVSFDESRSSVNDFSQRPVEVDGERRLLVGRRTGLSQLDIVDDEAVRHQHGPLEHALKLADISSPGMAEQLLERSRCQTQGRAAMLVR